MNATGHRSEISRYLDGVRAALADLPAGEREELLEELPTHLAEVAAETSGEPGALEERLGSPARYAADLRAAAGFAPGPTSNGGGPGLAASLARADRMLGRVIGYPRLSEFLRLLRPAWWVLRAYLVTLFVVTAYSDTSGAGLLPHSSQRNLLAWLVVGILTLVASVWLGRRTSTATDRRPASASLRAGTMLANLLVVAFGFWAVLVGEYDSRPTPASTVIDPYQNVVDVRPVGPDGQPLHGVQLYDQDGNPIRIGDPYRCQTSGDYPAQPQFRYPLCEPGSPSVAPSSSPSD